jgi:hypothetical protein
MYMVAVGGKMVAGARAGDSLSSRSEVQLLAIEVRQLSLEVLELALEYWS